MYLFTRIASVTAGTLRRRIAWALDQTERVNRITDLRFSLYTPAFSPQVGSLVWSTFVPDLTALEAADSKLMVEEDFLAAIEEGAEFLGSSLDDGVSQVLYGAPDPTRHIEYVGAVRTVCANGEFRRGLELGVEIAQRADRITGLQTLFVASMTGDYGTVGWLTGHPDVGSVERSNAALAADRDWLDFIDREASGAYTDEPGATQQLCYRRLA